MNVWKAITGTNAGEFSPLMLHKTDFDKYHKACETAENVDIHLQGPFESRCGSQYINEVKTSADDTRIVNFRFNDSIEYTIEVGDLYFRFYKDGVRLGAPYEIATPFQKEFLDYIVFAKASADVMDIISDYYPPYKLQRLGDTNWVLSRVVYDPPPTYVQNLDLKTTLTPSAASGLGITLTAGASVFLQADVDKIVVAGAARAIIVGYTSGTVVTADVIDPFPDTSAIPSGGWTIDGTPAATITASHFLPKGKAIKLFLSSGNLINLNNLLNTTTTAGVYYNEAHGRAVNDYIVIENGANNLYNGVHKVTLVPTSTTLQYVMEGNPQVGGGTEGTARHGYSGWRTTDVGKYVVMNNGIALITSYINNYVVNAKIIKSFKDRTSIAAGLWFLETHSFSLTSEETALSVTGITRSGNYATATTSGVHGYSAGDYVTVYGANQSDYLGIHRIYDVPLTTTFRFVALNSPITPATGTITVKRGQKNFPLGIDFFQGGKWLASTPQQPSTYWRSVIEDYESFAKGSEDDAAIDRTLTTFNRIKWLSANINNLAIGTDGEEFSVGSSREGDAITPTNIRDVLQTSSGSATNVQPITVDGVTLFVQKSTKKLLEYFYVFENNKYKAVDRTILAEHITGIGLKRIVYQKEPEPIIWCLRTDGVLIRFLYKSEEDIFCFSRYVTDGLYKDICITRNNNVEQLVTIVQRTINAATKKYVEIFNETMFTGVAGWNWTRPQTDCAIKVTNAPASVTVSGLSHLEAKTVAVLRDGVLHANRTVSSGSITLDTAGTNIEVGIPFTSTLIPTRPEVQLQDGTAQGRTKGWSEVVIRLHNSQGGTVNGEPLPDTLTTGDHTIYSLGYDLAGQLTFKRIQPLPLMVIGISGKLDVSTN